MRRWSGWALALALAGCRGEAKDEAKDETKAKTQEASAPAKRELEVGVAGCYVVEDRERGRRCLTRKPKPLHLWLDGASDPEIELRLDGVAIEAERTIDTDGLLLEVELADLRGRLELETEAGSWALELTPVSGSYETLRREVQASWKQADAATALALLERGATELGDDEAALLGCAVARVVMAAGDYEALYAIVEQVSGSAVSSCIGRASLLAAYVQIYVQPDFNAAEESLRAAEAVRGVDLETRIAGTYLRGVLEHRLGQIDESLLAFERTTRLARLVGDHKHLASALVQQAVALARLGRFAEAEALAREAEGQAAKFENPTLGLEIRSSVAWIAVLRREDDPSIADPSPMLRELVEAYEALGDQRNVANRRLDLALSSVQNNDLSAAAAELNQLDLDALDPELLVWFELTSARVELARGRFSSAADHLDRAALLADLYQDRELEWRATMTAGQLERARGRDDAALERFRDASELADELALAVAVDAGRSRFVTTHSQADLTLVELLLGRAKTEAAMCVAMAARARHLRGLWAQLRPPLEGQTERRYRDLLSRHQHHELLMMERLEGSWSLSTAQLEALHEQLRAEGERADRLLGEATALLERGAPRWTCAQVLPRRRGEAVLAMAPMSDGRSWSWFLAYRREGGELEIEHTELTLADAGELGSAAREGLERFAPALAHSEHLKVIPSGAFVSADLHRLWLAEGHTKPTITYSLGLGLVAEEPARLEPRAAVVAGSTNLAAVGEEAAAVARRLGEIGWVVESGWSPTAARQPSLLHYAGHGFSDDSLGWHSALELPELGRIDAAQIVAGQRSPDLVVLGACSAGRVSGEAIDGGMNLAAAFLLAGARMVIAPVREVDDEAALELGRGLYRGLGEPGPEALARALALLQREQLAAGGEPSADESFFSWRAWTP